jgi:predicted KAP-like P-loop ATPase
MPSVPAAAPLSADLPLASPDQDRLGYAGFAQHLANAIAVAPGDGIVLGLHGPAGSGRTSVANFLRADLAGAPSTVVLDFNPWLLGAELDICDRFFEQMLPALGGGGEWPEGAGQGLDRAELRARLGRALRAQRTRFVVVTDDLDRLSPAGMREVSRLVRTLAALPNLVHLLVFDRMRQEAADVSQVVQVPFDLPLPEAGSIQQLFLDQLRELLAQHPPPAVVTQHHFDQAFSPGIETLLATPREVVRLVNALRVSYPPLSAEVNTADFVAVEALRVFQPELYDLVRRTPGRFAGTTRPRTAGAVDDDTRRFHEAWRGSLDAGIRAGVTTLVMRLFPSVPDFEGLIVQRDAPSDAARQELRVASPELFSTYFRFVVPATSISNAEMDALLAQGRTGDAFGALLVRLAGERDASGSRRAERFLDRLADLVPTLEPELVAAAVGGLLEAGDDIGPDLDERVQALLDPLLRRLDPGRRLEVLRSEMANRAGVGLIVAEVARLGREHGRHGGPATVGEEERTVDLEGLAALEQVALARVREAAASWTLADVPRLPAVLGRWRVWDRNECMRWVGQAAARDDMLIKLVAGHLQLVRDPPPGDRGLHASYRLDPETMRPLIAPELIIERVRRLARERVATGAAQIALDQFVLEYELRQGDRDSGEPFDRDQRDTDAEE